MTTPAKALVIHCVDHRFVEPTVNFINSLGFGDACEDVGVDGSTKNIVDPYDVNDPEFVLRQIAIAKKLHNIPTVVLINHLDCDVYGQGTFATPQEEHDRHVRDLTNAKMVIEHRFEGMQVMTVLGRIDAQGKIDFEKIT